MRRVAEIIERIILTLVVLIVLLFALLCSSRVQTWITEKVTYALSQTFDNQIEIQSVDFSPFNHLNINGVYIEDLNRDTLLYIPEIKAKFNLFSLINHQVSVSEMVLIEPYINISADSLGTHNYDFLLDRLGSDSSSDGSSNMSFKVSEAIISNGRIAYHTTEAPIYADNRFHSDRFVFSNINLRIALNELRKGDIDAKIEHFSLEERSGFQLINFQAHLKLDSTQILMPTLRIELPNSLIDVSVLKATFPERDTTDRPLTNTEVEFMLNNGRISLQDLGTLIPAVRNVVKPIDISAGVNGKISDMRLSNLAVSYNGYQLVDGTVSISGLPNTDSTFFRANLNKISLNAAIAQDFMSDMYNRPYILPDVYHRLGEVRYHGSAQGNMNNVNLSGGFASAVGDIGTIGSLNRIVRNDSTHKSDLKFSGAIETQDFQLGELLAIENMGNLSFEVEAEGTMDTLRNMGLTVNGLVSEFEYNDYIYSNLNINGHYDGHSFAGDINMHDPHLWFDFDGKVDWHSNAPQYVFALNVESFHASELHLFKGEYEDIMLKMNANVDLSGNTLDNLKGKVELSNIYFYNNDEDILIPYVSLTSIVGKKDQPRRLQLTSDYINADIHGNYNYSSLPATLEKFCLQYLPNFFDETTKKKLAKTPTNNQLKLGIYTHGLPRLTNLLALKVQATDDISIKGEIDEPKNRIGIAGIIPGLNINTTNRLRNINFNVNNLSNIADISLSVNTLHNEKKKAAENMGDMSADLHMQANNDSVFTQLRFSNDSIHQLTRGMAELLVSFTSVDNQPQIKVDFSPTRMTILDIPWQVDRSNIVYTVAKKTLDINDFRLFSLWLDDDGKPQQHLYANGRGSTDPQDSISFNLKDIGLGWVVGISGFYGIDFGGRITGGGAVYTVFDQLMLNADLNMRDFSMNDVHIGHVHAQAEWLRDSTALHYFGDVYHDSDNHHLAHLDGQFRAKRKMWNIGIDSEGIPLGFITEWTSNIFGPLSGEAFGRVDIDGDTIGVDVSAYALVKNGQLGVDIIGETYYFDDTIKLTANHTMDSILFRNMHFHDAENNPVLVNGYVAHNDFKNFRYNIGISCTNAQVVNLPQNADNAFYGKVNATGNVSIVGSTNYCNIDIKAATRPHTRFGLALNRTSTAVDNDYITFIDTRPTAQETIRQNTSRGSFRMRLGLDIDVTPDALVILDIDKRTGDAIQARGDGNVIVNYQTPSGDVGLRGQLDISSGNVTYTLTNILRKEFKVEQGSTVVFNGDPMNTQLNIRAFYQTTASMRDLLGDQFQQAGLNRTFVPVNCIIDLSGALNNPQIGFDIDLPNSEETARQQVQSIINTDEMKMREILYLLAFNKFYTPDYLQSADESVGTAESLSLLTSTVTGQLNNWISKVTNDFQLGFNVHTSGAGDNMSQEYEGQFMYQLNNRLEINGNFGYRYNDISNQPFFGDIDVEYLLTESGRYRLKAYTHSVDKYSLKQASTVQGVGFVYKQNFDNFRDLFNIKPKQTNTSPTNNITTDMPTDSTAILPTDTISGIPTEQIEK